MIVWNLRLFEIEFKYLFVLVSTDTMYFVMQKFDNKLEEREQFDYIRRLLYIGIDL